MGITRNLDDEMEAKLNAESRRADRSFRDVVNETLRRGLANPPVSTTRHPFEAKACDLGDLKPGLTIDNVAELIEQVEGSTYR